MKLNLASLIIVTILVTACTRQEELILPPVSTLGGDNWYGIVNTAYLRLNSQMGGLGEAGLTLRGGDIVLVTQIRSLATGSGNSRFYSDYYFVITNDGSGWAASEQINLFNHRQTAEDAQIRFMLRSNN
ncbi:MAG: hypothetical protein FWE37_02360 [Spirochaetaceae bacterium]|nr:hypothetical protein [Spirochaetaceae bacterium]